MMRQVVLLLLILFSGPDFLTAQQNNSDSLQRDRTAYLRTCLQQNRRAEKTWWTGWLVGYSAATLVQTGIGLQGEKLALRQDMYLGAATTFLGAAGQLITPMPKTGDLLKTGEGSTYADSLDQWLREGEETLAHMAEREKQGRSWQTHAAAGAVNLASGLITWVGFKRDFKAGLVNFALNTLITEAQIWSQPVKARRHLEVYRKSQYTTGRWIPPSPGMSICASAGPGNFSVRLIF